MSDIAPYPDTHFPDEPCHICIKDIADCICPECPTCGAKGNSKCYKEHVLKLGRDQLIRRSMLTVARLREEADVSDAYVEWLKEQPDNYCEDWSEI